MQIKYYLPNKVLEYDGSSNSMYERSRTIPVKTNYIVGIIIDTTLTVHPLTGVTYRLYHLSLSLINHGNEVIWFVCNRNFNNLAEIEILMQIPIKIHIIPEIDFYNPISFARLILQENIDILQYEISQTFFSIGISLRRLTNLPCVLENHDIEYDLQASLGNLEKINELIFMQSISCKIADAVVCMTRNDKELIITRLLIEPDKIFLAPNGIYKTIEHNSIMRKSNILIF